ncbi:HPr-rel-A system PqqD family peptide chaperone [Allosphingosinicella sp.]|uniref:HPr-rel-A system PqqD family peptide chaperone n=1 Tax=Allosphingosinicella sp. TaxID=2823234 RepID=UPI002F2416BA
MTGPLYAADPPGAVRTVALDGLTALFHAPSGMTHIVASPAPEILEALTEGPADAAAILARIRARFDVDEEAPAELIEARLGELEAVGLVRRA